MGKFYVKPYYCLDFVIVNSFVMIKKILILSVVFLVNSCLFTNLTLSSKGDLKLKQVNFAELPGWQNDNQSVAVASFVNSCTQINKMAFNKKIGGAIDNVIAGDFRDVCKVAPIVGKMGDAQARNFFENWFVPFEVSSKSKGADGLFTGYYIPELRGSKTKSLRYRYPVYAKPDERYLNLSREQIEDGALANQGLELLYVDSKVDLFFMQIQGSGRVLMDDGSVTRLRFAAKNNHQYSSIGKYIADNQILPSTSYFEIKNWLRNNPKEAREVMNANKSYVFFAKSENDDIFGSMGAKLLSERSLAVDNQVMPMGTPLWVDVNSANRFQKLMVAQDTGSAIKGAVRGDIFFGRGENAENLAANMNYKGKYYVLLPTAVVDRMVGR